MLSLRESIFSTAQLSHSVDAVACYIIVMPSENLMSPEAQLMMDCKNKTKTLNTQFLRQILGCDLVLINGCRI